VRFVNTCPIDHWLLYLHKSRIAASYLKTMQPQLVSFVTQCGTGGYASAKLNICSLANIEGLFSYV